MGKEQASLQTTLLQSISNPYACFTTEGEIIYANPAFSRLFGEELMVEEGNIKTVLASGHEFVKIMEQLSIADEHGVGLSIQFRKANGSIVHTDVTSSLNRDSQNLPKTIELLLPSPNDFNGRRKLEEEFLAKENEFNTRIRELHNTSQNAQEKAEVILSKHQQCFSELSISREEVETLKKEKEQLEETTMLAKTTLDQRNEELKRALAELDRRSKKIKELKAVNNMVPPTALVQTSQFDSLSQQLREKEEYIEEANAKIRQLGERHAKLQRTLLSVRDCVKTAKDGSQPLSVLAEQVKTSHNSESSTLRFDELEKRLADSEKQLGRLRMQMAEKEEKALLLGKQLTAKEITVETLTANLQKVKEEQSLSETEQRLAEANKLLASQREEVNRLNKELEQFTKQKEEEIQLLQAKLEGQWQETEKRNQKQGDITSPTLSREEREQEVNGLNESLLKSIAKEIRVPMHEVLSYADLLANNASDAKVASYTDAIRSESKSILTLLDNWHLYSKLERKAVEFEDSEVNLQHLVTEVGSIFKAQLQKNNIRFFGKVQQEFPTGVKLDGARLRQIVFNLLRNSIINTQEGEIYFSVEGREASEENKVACSIKITDTGTPIDEQFIERVQAASFQKQEHINSIRKMVGPGIVISSKLVELMDGQLKFLFNSKGENTFYVEFPSLKVTDNRPLSETKSKNQLNLAGQNLLALITDDHSKNRHLIAAYLSAFGVRSVQAEGGQEALHIAKTRHPDIIFIDTQLPVLNGEETMKLLRQRPETRNIPIIALQRQYQNGEKERLEEAGFQSTLQKPTSRQELEKLMENLFLAD